MAGAGTLNHENDGFGFFEDSPAPAREVEPKGSQLAGSLAPINESAESGRSPQLPVSKPVGANTQSMAGEQPREAKNRGEEQQADSIRVQVALLDSLMNLIGELVLIRNQVVQYSRDNNADAEFSKMGQRLNVLTSELQNEVMKTRMQPVGNVLNKFVRVVRDLGRELNKKVDLEIRGAETELDKTIIEAVKDPLMHIVRNSVDHGIESPEERLRAGKPEAGRVILNAHHESGQVIIEIQDDGKGLDRAKIEAKAIEKGLMSAEQCARANEREIFQLIFSSGFSTATKVSNVSGRGVGMDVVRTNIERIGGVVDVQSEKGRGMVIRLKIPLTLAIVPALIVSSGGQRFAIPQSKLAELLRIDETDSGADRLESLQGRPVLRLRGRLLPLVKMSEILGQSATGGQKHRRAGFGTWEETEHKIAVLNADSFRFGLIVDEIEDSADIVVKSMPQFLNQISAFSGATILGDGTVALTVDVSGLAEMVRTASADQVEGADAANQDTLGASKPMEDESDFLLVDLGAEGDYAIPLSVVNRLEQFEQEQFEVSGEQRVVRYRGALLPIFALHEYLRLPFKDQEDGDFLTSVVVVKRGDRYFGVAVKGIRDVARLSANVDDKVRDRPGVLGTLVANDGVVVVVDVYGMLDEVSLKLERGGKPGNSVAASKAEARDLSSLRARFRIMIAEDSAFFRRYMGRILGEAGYDVSLAADGAEALTKLEESPEGSYSLVVSDIEMPTMDGWELARRLRGSAKWKSVPLVAVTTRSGKDDVEKGKIAGFNGYLAKLNAEELLGEVDSLLSITELAHSPQENRLSRSRTASI